MSEEYCYANSTKLSSNNPLSMIHVINAYNRIQNELTARLFKMTKNGQN